MIPQVVTVGPLVVASANNICASQTPVGAGNLTINGSAASGGVATLDVARRVLITAAANETGHNFTITGTNHTGNPIQEVVAGPNATTAFTNQDFLTITSIAISAAATGALTVGTNGVASSPWRHIDHFAQQVNISFAVVVSGTVNYTIEYTYDEPNSNQIGIGPAGGKYPAVPTSFKHPVLQSLTTTSDSASNDPVRAWRLTLNSQTNPGSATATEIQSGANF